MPLQHSRPRLHLPQRALALVLARKAGCLLAASDGQRAAAAAHFGGKFRTIDFTLSNCLNSGIRRVGVITHYKSHSLQRHLERGWAPVKTDADPFVSLLTARRPRDDQEQCDGSAEAVASHQDILDSYLAEYVLVLGGEHIYKMNYAAMLADHVAKGRECTVACIEVPLDEARALGVVSVDAQWRITDFNQQPAEPACMPGRSDRALASMGIYIFNANYLYAELARDRADPTSSHDFDRDLVPHAVRGGDAVAHPFAQSCVGTAPGNTPYWRDVGTIDAYWQANIDLTATQPLLDLYDIHWPIRTNHTELASAKFLHDQPDRRGMAVESLVAGGCVISGSVARSVLCAGVRVHSYANVESSVLLPDVAVGRHAHLRRVVVDRGCSIPDGLIVGVDAAADAERFLRTNNGVTLITAERLARLLP